jgi:predicted Na+-dependent transporter
MSCHARVANLGRDGSDVNDSRHLCERFCNHVDCMNPTLILGLAVAAGLLVPALSRLPNALAIAALALALLLAHAAAPASRPRELRAGALALFVAVRFALLPAVLYAVARVTAPELATGVGLLAAVPVGVAAPTLVGASGGDSARASALLVITTLLFVVVVSLAGSRIAPDFSIATALGVTGLAIGPLVAGAPLRRALASDRLVSRARAISLGLVGAAIAIITARGVAALPSAPETLALLAAVALAEFACFYATARALATLLRESDTRAWEVASGFNNNVLGAALAALYLSPLSVLFLSLANPCCSLAYLLWSAWRRR